MTQERAVVDPNEIGDKNEFAESLSRLRAAVGRTIRDISHETEVPAGTLGGYFAGRHLPSPNQPELLRALLRACGVVAESEVQAWISALDRARRARPRPVEGPNHNMGEAPYRGLRSYSVDDAQWFFGREELTRRLLLRVEQLQLGPDLRLLTVVGPSGSGKSSLLRAGLLSGLPSRFTGTLITPGSQPLLNLQAGLERLARQPGSEKVLIVDQLEELYTNRTGSPSSSEFLAAVRRLADPEQPSPTTVVLGLRADFYAAAMSSPDLVSALQREQVLVGAMSGSELRRAVVEPARAAGLAVDDDLVEVVLRDLEPSGTAGLAYDAGALPLLSHALHSTWQQSTRGLMTVAGYRASGGIQGSIAQTAESLFTSLTPAEQETVRRIFLRLANIEDEHAITRRRVDRAELVQNEPVEDAAAAAHDVDSVLDRFIRQRLITAHQQSVEVSHEALLAQWPRLRAWIDEDRDGLRAHRQVTVAAQAWDEAGRDPSALLRGGRLEVATGLIDHSVRRLDMNQLERTFVHVSRDAEQREQRAHRRRTRRLQGLLATVTVLLLVAAGLAALALRARGNADGARRQETAARDDAISRAVAIESQELRRTDPSLAMQVALAAYRVNPTVTARSSLLDSLAVPTASRVAGAAGSMSLAASPRGDLAAVVSVDGRLRLFRETGSGNAPVLVAAVQADPDRQSLFSVVFSPDAATVAVAGASGKVSLFDVRQASAPVRRGSVLSATATGNAASVNALAWSADGTRLLAATSDGSVARWDVTDVDRPVAQSPLVPAQRRPDGPAAPPAAPAAVQAVALSPDGRLIATGTANGLFQLWDARSGAALGAVQVGAATSFVLSLAFSPDSRSLAVGGKGAVVGLYDVSGQPSLTEDTAPAATLGGFGSWVNAIAFTADGTRLAAASSDGVVHVFNVGQRRAVDLLPVAGPATAVAFAAADTVLLSGDITGTTHAWPIPGPLLDDTGTTAFTLGSNAAGTRLAVGVGKVNQMLLYDTSHPDRVGLATPPFSPPTGPATLDGASSISADGSMVASGTAAGVVYLWNTAVNPPVLLAQLDDGNTDLIESTVFSPDGSLLVSVGDDNKARLWDLTDRTHPAELAALDGGNKYLSIAAFNPAGTILAAAGVDTRVRLWDVANHRAPRLVSTLTEFTNYVYGLSFSPDGRTLAGASVDGTVRRWTVTDPGHPRELGAPLTGDAFTTVVFSPDGKQLLAGSDNADVWLWSVDDPLRPTVLATLRASSAQNSGALFSPDGKWIYAAGNDKLVRVWSATPELAASRICALAGDPITPAEWNRYVIGVAYRPPCGG